MISCYPERKEVEGNRCVLIQNWPSLPKNSWDERELVTAKFCGVIDCIYMILLCSIHLTKQQKTKKWRWFALHPLNVSHSFPFLHCRRTGACCRSLRDAAAGSTLVRRSHQRLGFTGLYTLRTGAHGEDLQPAAPPWPASKSQKHDEKVILDCTNFTLCFHFHFKLTWKWKSLLESAVSILMNSVTVVTPFPFLLVLIQWLFFFVIAFLFLFF